MSREDFFWDGYLHWARAIEDTKPIWDPSPFRQAANQGLEIFEPIFIQLKSRPANETLVSLNKLYVDGNADVSRILQFDAFAFLDFESLVFDLEDFFIGLQHCLFACAPFEFFVYRIVARTKEEHTKNDHLYTVIDVGAPALVRQPSNLVPRDDLNRFLGAPVIGAVIDNDIGFLNRRFRNSENLVNGPEGSRVLRIWLQSRERLDDGSTAAPSVDPAQHAVAPSYIHIGRVLRKIEIDRMIADITKVESSIYREVNSDLHIWEPFMQEPPNVSHGTAVSDLVFGADLDDPLADVPVLGVQLPPEAAVDTSGTYSESYIVQGVRWLCAQARLINPSAKLVINISYGALAGQKDGGKFLEAQVKREIELAKCHPTNGKPRQSVHVVYAFGNSLNTRQVAECTVAAGKTAKTLRWDISPDNPVPSFLEIRGMKTKKDCKKPVSIPDCFRVTLIGPDGREKLSAQPAKGEACPPLESSPDTADCRVYHVPERRLKPRPKNLAFYNVAIAPTRRISDQVRPAEAGEWQVSIENTGDKSIDLVMQIQRGDTAPGFSIGGRQSNFVGNFKEIVVDENYAFDVEAPLTNDGTNSSYSTASHVQIYTAGAQKTVFGKTLRADYSSKGAAWTQIKHPTDCEIVDSIYTYGVPAAGTYSGTTSRLSGTSAAAALVSNKLIVDKKVP